MNRAHKCLWSEKEGEPCWLATMEARLSWSGLTYPSASEEERECAEKGRVCWKSWRLSGSLGETKEEDFESGFRNSSLAPTSRFLYEVGDVGFPDPLLFL